VFLGNGGAYAVGTILAAGAVGAGDGGSWPGLLGAALILGLFAFELLFTVARRIGAGGGVTTGDRFHSYDLLALRRPRPIVTLIFWVIGIAGAWSGLIVERLSFISAVAVTAGLTVIAAVGGYRLWIDMNDEHLKGSMR
jgi:UDP-N-acetylmuramyl pentapeptide phosphotransferase/UDP-N-acetylglucosamine-1-phosphate transferase